MKTCNHCHRELEEERFERFPTGTLRGVCRQCHYELHTRAATKRLRLRQKLELLYH